MKLPKRCWKCSALYTGPQCLNCKYELVAAHELAAMHDDEKTVRQLIIRVNLNANKGCVELEGVIGELHMLQYLLLEDLDTGPAQELFHQAVQDIEDRFVYTIRMHKERLAKYDSRACDQGNRG